MVLLEEIEIEKTCRMCMRQIGQRMQPLETYETLIQDLTQVEVGFLTTFYDSKSNFIK